MSRHLRLLALFVALLIGAAWMGYRAGDAQAGWAALWSLCVSPR